MKVGQVQCVCGQDDFVLLISKGWICKACGKDLNDSKVLYDYSKTEIDERNLEDLGFYRGDPDAGRSEADLRGELDEYDE